MNIIITDNTGEYEKITASWHDIKVDGSLFGNADTCYFGIFANAGPSLQETWVIGSDMMSQKYYFLDMGPYINDERAYLAVGIGPINPVDLIGETHYDYKSNDFMPENKDNDMSE